jgi:hypothetical protein
MLPAPPPTLRSKVDIECISRQVGDLQDIRAKGVEMRMSECAGVEPAALPDWARFFLKMGYDWVRQPAKRRRIGLVLVPCPGGVAGLIALGATAARLVGDVVDPITNHWNRLVQAANSAAINPANAGDIQKIDGKQRYRFLGLEQGRIRVQNNKVNRGANIPHVSEKNCHEWHFPGENPIVLNDRFDVDPCLSSFYQRLCCDLDADLEKGIEKRNDNIDRNLRQSDYRLCFAQRRTLPTKFIDQYRFQFSGDDPLPKYLGLRRALMVNSWRGKTEQPGVARALLFRPSRKAIDEQFDAGNRREIKLTIADGWSALKAVNEGPGNARERQAHTDGKSFADGDLIGVVSYSEGREKLEQVKEFVQSKLNRYQLIRPVQPGSRGITTLMLEQGQ